MEILDMYIDRKNIIIIIICGLCMGVLYLNLDIFVENKSTNDKLPNDIITNCPAGMENDFNSKLRRNITVRPISILN